MAAPKIIPTKTWDAIWMDYLRGGRQGSTFSALAEAHGVHRTTIARHANAHGWPKARRVHCARENIRQHEEGLAYSRALAIEVSRHVTALCRDPRATLETLHLELDEAHGTLGDVARQAMMLARARVMLRMAEAGEVDTWRAEAGFPRHDPRYESPTRWPDYEYVTHYGRGGRRRGGRRPSETARAYKTGKRLRILRPPTRAERTRRAA